MEGCCDKGCYGEKPNNGIVDAASSLPETTLSEKARGFYPKEETVSTPEIVDFCYSVP